jgi:hypothetical protein
MRRRVSRVSRRMLLTLVGLVFGVCAGLGAGGVLVNRVAGRWQPVGLPAGTVMRIVASDIDTVHVQMENGKLYFCRPPWEGRCLEESSPLMSEFSYDDSCVTSAPGPLILPALPGQLVDASEATDCSAGVVDTAHFALAADGTLWVRQYFSTDRDKLLGAIALLLGPAMGVAGALLFRALGLRILAVASHTV